MNLKWKPTTEADYTEFSTWTAEENFVNAFGHKVNNISQFITPKISFDEHIKSTIKLNKSGEINVKIKTICNECDEIVGCVVFGEDEVINKKTNEVVPCVTINNIVVNPKFQHRGYGTAMVFDMVKYREQVFGFKPVVISAFISADNFPSQKLFTKHKFKPVAKDLDGYLDVYSLKVKEEKPKIESDKAILRLLNKLLNDKKPTTKMQEPTTTQQNKLALPKQNNNGASAKR